MSKCVIPISACFTLLCNSSTSFYLILLPSIIALIHATLLYYGSTIAVLHYFALNYCTMALLHSILIYIIHLWFYFITLPWIYFTLLDSTLPCPGSSFCFTVHYSTKALLHATLLYITLPWLYFILLDSKLLYHSYTSLYFTLLYHGSTSL